MTPTLFCYREQHWFFTASFLSEQNPVVHCTMTCYNQMQVPQREVYLLTFLTPRKMRRIFAYIKKRRLPVKITYLYANSLGDFAERIYTGIISDYTVTLYEGVEFQIDIAFSNGAKLHEHLGWETYFTESSPNKTTLEYCNDGPYCQFIIETIPEHK